MVVGLPQHPNGQHRSHQVDGDSFVVGRWASLALIAFAFLDQGMYGAVVGVGPLGFQQAHLLSDNPGCGASPVVHGESAEMVMADFEAGGADGGTVVIEFVSCEPQMIIL